MGKDNIKFEKALERLEEIVSTLESGDLELEKSLKMFEEGINMTKICRAHLNEAEKKIEKLVKDQEGKFSMEPLEQKHEEDANQDELPF
ncbi:MAG: hypothetical protein IEMM0002_1472 [bacterium]|nr:MAG: hypothetical protein IEMM0002_1472 [bacterium]